MAAAMNLHFVYHASMNVEHPDLAVPRIAAAIGEPARARMLYCLMDGRARTSTELAVVGGVSPSTASVHLARLKAARLVNVLVQGKHRYHSLNGESVGVALEALNVLAGRPRHAFASRTPSRLRAARTCYDHMAGAVAVALHDRFLTLKWLTAASGGDNGCVLTGTGAEAFETLGIDVEATRTLRRRLAYGCLDWSERRPHLGGALGAAFLTLALRKKWVAPDLDSRALTVTAAGRRELLARFGVPPTA
jgi:DNA-binding transcriptional ArsR family regulator